GGIDHLEIVLLRQNVELLQQRALILSEALKHVLAGMQVHAGFPVIEPTREDDSRHQVVHADTQVEYGIGLQSKAVNVVDPRGINTTHHRACDQRVDIAVGQYHEPCA